MRSILRRACLPGALVLAAASVTGCGDDGESTDKVPLGGDLVFVRGSDLMVLRDGDLDAHSVDVPIVPPPSAVAISADGIRAAVAFQFGGGREPGGLAVSDAEASCIELPVVGHVEGVDWSPDGGEVVAAGFALGEPSGLMIVDADSGTRRTIVEGEITGPSWRPDGLAIAYARSDESLGPADIMSIGVDGDAEAVVVGGPEDDVEPAWSPDGGSIAFVRRAGEDASLAIVDVDTGDVRTFETDLQSPRSPSWVPDGRHIVIADAERGVFAVDIASGDVSLVVEGSGEEFRPDGSPRVVVQLALDGDMAYAEDC